MSPGDFRGYTNDYQLLPSPQDHDGGDAGGRGSGSDTVAGSAIVSRTDSWVWPPPRTKNSALAINNDKGTCSCVVSQIQRQQQQQQQQRTFDCTSLMMPAAGYHNSEKRSSSENNQRALRFLFCKELTHSDIKKRNKIILPKRDAEIHLPSIESKHGIRIYMEDKETIETWCFKFRYRITNNSKVHSLEGTRHFLQVHDLKAGDYIVIYKDDARRRYVIGVSKEMKETLPNRESSVSTGSLVSNLGIKSSSSYTYLNQLSEFSVVDEMEEVATPRTPYPYGSATWNGHLSCELERLPSLQTFKFFDLPLDYIFWI